MMDQLGVQALCVAIVIVWSLAVSYVIIKVTQGLFGLRVDPEDENTGLDLPSHGERGYEL